MVRSVFILLFLVLTAIAMPVFADDLSVQGQIQSPPIVIAKNNDTAVYIARQAGTSTYTDASTGFQLTSAANFSLTADLNRAVTIVSPNSVNLTSGANTATATLVCRASQASLPATKTDGTDCASAVTTGNDGKLYISIFPTELVFANEGATGSYTGTINISVNYN